MIFKYYIAVRCNTETKQVIMQVNMQMYRHKITCSKMIRDHTKPTHAHLLSESLG